MEGVNNYYPFGLLHNSQYTNFDNAYQYKYNGKELQESGMYDYGARFYMPDLGRWGVIDNKAEKYISLSSYHYAGNNPVLYLDIDGNEFTEDAWVWVNKLLGDINSRQGRNNSDIAKLRARMESGKAGEKEIKRLTNRIAGLEANNAELEGVRGEINTLSASNQVYDVVTDNGGTQTSFSGSTTINQTTFNSKNDRVQLTVSSGTSLSLFAHELKHMYQFEVSENSLGLTKTDGAVNLRNGNLLFYDLSDEVEGYKRSALFGEKTIINSTADILSLEIYNPKIPKGPINSVTHPDAAKIKQDPQSFANKYNAAFRINNTTYKPK